MLSKLEILKDLAQVTVESGAKHTGNIAVIISGAVGKVVSELGEWATEVFEMVEDAQRAPKKSEDSNQRP
jgi:hypothetical protein